MDQNEANVCKKSISLFLSIILVLAIVGWNMGFVSGAEGDGPFDFGGFLGLFGGGGIENIPSLDFTRMPKDFKIDVVEDGKFQISYTDLAGTKISGTATVDQLNSNLGKFIKDGALTIKAGDEERKIPLDNLPKGLESIQIDRIKDEIIYNINEGKVVLGDDSILTKDGEGIALRGYEIDGKKEDIKIKIGKGGEIRTHSAQISNSAGAVAYSNFIKYKGDGTSIDFGKMKVESISGKEGVISFGGKDRSLDSFTISNSKLSGKIDGKEFGLTVGEKGSDESIYFGDLSRTPTNLKDRALSFDGKKLTGNLNGIKEGDEIKFSNLGSEKISVDGSLFDLGENGLEASKEVIFKKEGGELKGLVETTSETVATTSSSDDTTAGNEKKPDIPTVGTVTTPPGTDPTDPNNPIDPNNPVDPNNPIDPNGGGGGYGGGEGGGSGGGLLGGGWLKWALIIGAGILAAMLLFGNDDEEDSEEEEEEDDEPISDSGEEYQGTENITFKHGNVTPTQKGGPTITYNPTPPAGGSASGKGPGESCVCNQSGCFSCPGDNCFDCNSDAESPVIQGSSEEDDGASEDAQTTENDLDLVVR